MTKFQPLEDRILAKRFKEEDVTAGGIIIPDANKEKPNKAKVIEVGPGQRSSNGALVTPCVSVGDTILFTKWGGTEIELDGETYIVLREADVLGITHG